MAVAVLLPELGSEVQVLRADQVADPAAFVYFAQALPEVLKFAFQRIWLIQHHGGARQQIEEHGVRAGHWSIELPSREDGDAGGQRRLFQDLFRTRNAPSGESSVNGAQQLLGGGRFGQRQQYHFVQRRGGALGGRVEFANGLDFVAEQLKAGGAVGLGRINVENAAAHGVLAGHLHHISGGIAHRVQVPGKSFHVHGFASPQHSCQFAVELGRAQADAGGAAPVKLQKDCSRGSTSSAARLSATTSTRGRPAARCSSTVARALAVGVRPETLTRPVPSLRWEAARARGARLSASAKISRTKGRTIALLFYQQAGEIAGPLGVTRFTCSAAK